MTGVPVEAGQPPAQHTAALAAGVDSRENHQGGDRDQHYRCVFLHDRETTCGHLNGS